MSFLSHGTLSYILAYTRLMTKFPFFIWSIIFLSLYPSALWAQTIDTDRLGVKDLRANQKEELINQSIQVASKSAESIYEAPGVISVITAQEINRFGANNLLEVLERATSTYYMGSYFAPNNIISIRGDLSTPYNNHVLILINGRPTRETLFGGLDYSILLSLPLIAIERIELIRGPGSVLYGTNAYAGVINIITRDVKEGSTTVSVQSGSFGTIGLDAQSTRIKNDLKVTTSVRYFNQAGWDLNASGERRDVDPVFQDRVAYLAGQNNLGGLFTLDYKGLSVSSLIAYSSQPNTGTVPVSNFETDSTNHPPPSRNREINTLRAFVDVGYQFDLSDRSNLSINATYNAMNTRFVTPNGDFVGNTQDLILEPTFFQEWDFGLNLTLGGTAFLQDGNAEIGDVTINANDTINRGVPSYAELWYSAYAQAEYKLPFFDNVKLVAGGQLNRPAGTEVTIAPRIGLIGQFQSGQAKLAGERGAWGFKLLYGEALRAPFEAENNLNDPGTLLGSDDLDPETVTTLDAQLFYYRPGLEIIATFFDNQVKRVITQVDPNPNDADGTFQYINAAGNLREQGVELESKIALIDRVFLSGSVTYQTDIRSTLETETNQDIPDLRLTPEFMFKVGAFYYWKEKDLSVGLFDSYFGKSRGVSTQNDFNAPAAAFHNLTFNANLNLSRLFFGKKSQAEIDSTSRLSERTKIENQNIPDIILNFYVVNLLDEGIFYPEFVRRQINTFPGRSGRGIYASLKINF